MKSPLYLTENLPGGQLPLVLWRSPIRLLSKKEERKKEKEEEGKDAPHNIIQIHNNVMWEW
jgi:hypothetical protein